MSQHVKKQKIEGNDQVHAQEAAECHREGRQYTPKYQPESFTTQ